MNNKKFFSLGIKNKVFKIPQNEVSFVYSKNFDDIFFPIKNFLQNKNFEKNNLLQIQNGKIPSLSLNEEIKIENPKNVVLNFFNHQLIGKEIFKGILINKASINEQDFFTSNNTTCPDCNTPTTPILSKDFLLNFLNKNENKAIFLGINSWNEKETFDIKKLIKKNIYYILKEDTASLNKEIVEIDEVKPPFNFKFMTILEKISKDKIQEIFEILNNFSKKKIENIFFYIKDEKKFIPINLFSSFYCSACNKIFNLSLEKQNSNLEILNIKIKDAKKTNLSFLNSLNTSGFTEYFKNILTLLSDFGFEDFSLIDKIQYARDAFLLNLISNIECNKRKDKIFFIISPLSFLSKKNFQKILKLLENETVIIFENNEEILSNKNIFKLENDDKKINFKFDNDNLNFSLPIKNHKINIINTTENNLCNIACDIKFNKIIEVAPLYFQDTFLASFIGIFNNIRDIITKTSDAKKLGLTIKDFNLSGKYAKTCQTCLGKGYIKNSFNIINECPSCHGGMYNKEILNLKFKNKTLLEILKMTVLEANDFFSGFLKISDKLKILINLEFSNYPLNFPTSMLPTNKLKMIEIFNNFNTLSQDNLYILKDGLIFLSQEEKGRLFKTLEPFLKTNTIIFEAKY